MTPDIINQLIEKQPKLKSLRKRLEALELGTACLHPTWGVGLIKEYDALENKLILNFEQAGKVNHRMDPVFCAEKLDILPKGHVLVIREEQPEEIERLIKEDPIELIVAILSHCRNQSATGPEIERLLSRLIGPIKYKKWWSSTKKLLIKEPRIAVPEKKTAPYVLREEPMKPEEEVLQEFENSKSIKRQIQLAEKLIELSVKHEDIKEKLPEVLKTLTNGIQNSRQLNQAERLQAIWVRNDLARFIHEDPETLEPPSASIIDAEIDVLPRLASLISPSYFRRFLELIQRCQPQKWEKITFELLRHSSGKFTNECIVFLMDQDLEPKIKKNLKRWLDEQTLKEPILTWILKNRHSKRYAKMLQVLISPRLLSALFYAIDHEALQNTTSRRIPLAEMLSEDKEIITELLADADEEIAHDLATTLLINQGFEDLSKKSIFARFIRLFPSTQELITGREESDKKEETEELVVSIESYEARRNEYQILTQEKIPENKQAIVIAREHGDLRENAEYKMARQEQDTLLALKAQIEQELAHARQTDFQDVSTDHVGIGSCVELKKATDDQQVNYTILGAWDSDPDKNILSYQTPLGKKLLGKTAGETIVANISGTQEEWHIQTIERYVDKQ